METAMTATIEQFHDCMDEVDDPRVVGRTTHPLKSILLLTLAATTAGADGPEEIECFGIERIDRLAELGDFSEGIASQDMIGRVLAAVCPTQFRQRPTGVTPQRHRRGRSPGRRW